LGAEPENWVGRSIERSEDAALLTGRGRFIDDLAIRPGTLHAAILRSPHAHARIDAIAVDKARALPGVAVVIVGADLAEHTAPIIAGIRAPIETRVMATDRVRYVGEPVAVVLAADRYCAEDALDLIEVTYYPLPAIIDPEAAAEPGAPVLHDGLGGNIVSDRRFSYGDPEAAFAAASHRVRVIIRYPRNTGAPIETYGVVAEYDPHEKSYDILANFQGPFSIHAVVARALKIGGNRLRLRLPPESGGSFGVKQGVAPYMVLIAAAARIAGRPVKWVEDRLEHLAAAVSATNRVTTLIAAVAADGEVLALDWDQLEDCGATLRAPEPATLYRMHGNMTGAYAIRHVRIRNRVVLTNKTPTGLVRGFGGPQVYYALERLTSRIARTLALDPLAVIRRNLIPREAFPYRTATGALYDSGDYQRAVEAAVREGDLAAIERRREEARAQGRLYGIGFAAIVEPSVSNMGYITTALTAAERRKAGPKNGAQATATVTLDPLGAVTVQVASAPQGQGHRTVLGQVVADELGLTPADIRVITELDTAKDAWSIASGNYSSRFAPAVAGAAKRAAEQMRGRLARIAASQLNTVAEDLVFAGGRIVSWRNPDLALSFGRIAATSHWAPATVPEDVAPAIRETAFWTPPELTAPNDADEVNSSLCHGFIFDFCGVEIDRLSGKVRIDRYVTMHDCGRILHPAMADGQIRGGFAQGLGAAFLEELGYSEDGAFLAGTFADYLLPTATEVPPIEILHIETSSPFTPLGAKGVGEGNCMSTPVCLANAVADALGVDELDLPLMPAKLVALAHGPERPRPPGARSIEAAAKTGARALIGEGRARVHVAPERLWAMLLDPETLAALIPGAYDVRRLSPTHFVTEVTLGVGPVRGRYHTDIRLSDLDPPRAVTLSGTVSGGLGIGGGKGRIVFAPEEGGWTAISYRYEAFAGGKVAAVGGRLLNGAARVIIGQFFAALANRTDGAGAATAWRRRLARLRARLGIGG
jgi:2-furoyl-CoA dehydrogenase large subunit